MAELLDHTSYFSKEFIHSLQGYFGNQRIFLQALEGDASTRRYFLVQSHNQEQNYIACVAPAESNNNQAFFRIQQAWKQANIEVPEIYEYLADSGEFLLEYLEGLDFVETVGIGNSLQAPSSSSIFYSYSKALGLLAKIQNLHLEDRETTEHYTRYHEQGSLAEMQLFRDWFIPHFGDAELAKSYDQQKGRITESFLEMPSSIVHRDFHSRNLKWHSGRLFVLDFQDAILGPATYDLVSLLYDCYVDLPSLLKYQIFLKYYSWQLHKFYDSPEEAYRDFGLVAMQRLLKVAGIFCRLAFRDGKTRYLESLPLCLQHLLEASAECRQAREFHAVLKARIGGILERIDASLASKGKQD